MATRACGRSRAFTLIELLVVIAIIALLIGILLPALSNARKTSKMLAEQQGLKQWTMAYFTYTATFKDQTLPAAPHWNWNHAAGARYAMFPQDPWDKAGLLWHSITKVYTAQLAGYMDFNMNAIQIDKATYSEFYSRPQGITNQSGPYRDYTAGSFLGGLVWHPSWGINGVYVGGAYPFNAFWPGKPGYNYKSAGGHFYVTNMSQVNRAERLILFSTARAGDVATSPAYWSYGDVLNAPADTGAIRPGHWLITPPKAFPHNGRSPWSSAANPPTNPPPGGVTLQGGWTTVDGQSNKFDPNKRPSTWGYLDGRHFGKMATSHMDGNVTMLKLEQMRDMTRWSNYARTSDWNFVAQ